MRIIRAVLLGLCFSGCAGFQFNNAPHQDKDVPKRAQQFLSVPFFADSTDQCGPSALASVLTFWGDAVEPVTLKKEIYLANLKGSLPLDLLLSAQNHGFKAHIYQGTLEDLKSELRKGHPVIAFINLGFEYFPIGHYLVVTGYDETRRGFIVHSGTSANRFFSYRTFLRNWNKTQRSTLLILPPARDAESPHADL